MEPMLSRREASEYLSQIGCPTAPATLASMVTRGGGPLYSLWGGRAVYRKADLISWAESRLTPPRRSTSEADAAQTPK